MFISREGPILGMQMGVTTNLLINKNFSYFTYSREALIEILKFNKISSGDEILLPNYLCSTVIESIFPITENIKYYTINDSLSYSKSEVSGLISNKTRLIIFVDYFGVETRVDKDLELELKNNKIILIKDSSHSFLSLVNRNFHKDYNYDYLISSIYKNIPIHVGSIAIGNFGRVCNFINLSILIKRFVVLFLKNIICFFGQNRFINRNVQNISISSNTPIDYSYGFNAIKFYQKILFHINFRKIITEKQDLVSIFNGFFSSNLTYKPLFTQEIMDQNILQAYPVLFKDKAQRDSMLSFLSKNCIDAYTWPTFHRTNCDDFLWGRVLLLPLNIKVIKALQNV
jgi:hypothetical protein